MTKSLKKLSQIPREEIIIIEVLSGSFIEDPNSHLIGDPKFFIRDPQIFIKTQSLGSPIKILGSPLRR